jgi:hypothetical protein
VKNVPALFASSLLAWLAGNKTKLKFVNFKSLLKVVVLGA